MPYRNSLFLEPIIGWHCVLVPSLSNSTTVTTDYWILTNNPDRNLSKLKPEKQRTNEIRNTNQWA